MTETVKVRAVRVAATKPVPQAKIRTVADTRRGALAGARVANEVLKAQTVTIRLEKIKAKAIDTGRATAIKHWCDTAHGGAWAIYLRAKAANGKNCVRSL